MRFLGIDYGTKRIGVALSDEAGTIAMPHGIVASGPSAIEEIFGIIKNQNVGVVIIGESKDFNGVENPVMEKIKAFREKLQAKIGKGIPIAFEPEFLTSHHAQRFQGKNDLLDASAAALILQSYLDRHNSPS